MTQIDSKTIEYVRKHREEDVNELALHPRKADGVNLPWALNQIAGWQMARRKLPAWAATEGIIYPPHLSLEQCSSERTAYYKAQIVWRTMPKRNRLIDLTGGFGVDFSYLAPIFSRAVYVEQQETLCEIARNNLDVIGLKAAEVVNATAEAYLQQLDIVPDTLIYLDPARRDAGGSKTFAISDCTPNVLALRAALRATKARVMLKLSPMLDWHKAVADVGTDWMSEVHIVSVGNECKELLLLTKKLNDKDETLPKDCTNKSYSKEEALRVYCVNNDASFVYTPSQATPALPYCSTDECAAGHYLYEPNASLMKAGCFAALADYYQVKAVGKNSHLFVSSQRIIGFPGRCFLIETVSPANKKALRQALSGIKQANIAVRNFPATVAALRKQWKIADGGNLYLFATTLGEGTHSLIVSRKT